ncbi:MAG: low molecular weight phosphotyrosine protein phosphatase [Clostridiales bacterium]|nr:low molecular weight phosphotyrosine protein phosphatase [Clostridiales bacterium]
MKKKTRILFVCHGNICRSPMAEFIMRDLVEKNGLSGEIEVESAATSTEERGNPVHRETKRILDMLGIDCAEKRARQMQSADYEAFDYLIGMDRMNAANMSFITGGDPEGKICRLLDFAVNPRDIADPWYTGDFDATYRDVRAGCEALLKRIQKHNLCIPAALRVVQIQAR